MNAPSPPLALRQPSQRLKLRPLQTTDVAGVQSLLARHGQSARSSAGLKWALLDNPARVLLGVDAGWVLENDAGIVGFLGNLPSQCLDEGQMRWGASCTTPVVDEPVRAHAIRLLRAFATQSDASFLTVVPDTPALAKVFASLGFNSPHPTGPEARLQWRVGRGSLLERTTWGLSTGSQLRLPRWARRSASVGADTALVEADAGFQVRRITADELAGVCPGAWPTVWNAWATRFWNRPGLWPERSAYHLSWRLSDPDLAGQLALWGVIDSAGTLLGMALARSLAPSDMTDAPAPYAELMDWAILPQAAGVAADPLLRAVLAWAASQGAGTLRADALSSEAAQQLQALGPKQLPAPFEPGLVLQARAASPAPAADGDSERLEACLSTNPGFRWFYTGLKESTEAAPTWHPARAPHRVVAPAASEIVDITSPASAYQ